jgi:hypothetical protein
MWLIRAKKKKKKKKKRFIPALFTKRYLDLE